MSLRGPVLTLTCRREALSFIGSAGVGLDGNQKCPLIFFILCRYIDKVYTYIYM